ncbi:MAG: hypothetical protein GX446_16010 [Chthonomonadales bacterium]|nr:hypothetical protein [Chthonomonadales bacterium]
MRGLAVVLLIACTDIAGAGAISGRIAMKGGRPSSVKAGYVGVTRSGQSLFNSAGLTIGSFRGSVASTTFKPRVTRLDWDPRPACTFEHTGLPPGRYLVWVRCDDHYMDWRVVTLDKDTASATVTLGWSKTDRGDIKLLVKHRSSAYNVRVSPLGPDGKTPLPEADVPMYAGWDIDVTGTALLLRGMRPGVYQVELRRQRKLAGASGGWSAMLQEAGTWSIKVVAGQHREYTLQ